MNDHLIAQRICGGGCRVWEGRRAGVGWGMREDGAESEREGGGGRMPGLIAKGAPAKEVAAKEGVASAMTLATGAAAKIPRLVTTGPLLAISPDCSIDVEVP